MPGIEQSQNEILNVVAIIILVKDRLRTQFRHLVKARRALRKVKVRSNIKMLKNFSVEGQGQTVTATRPTAKAS